MLTCTTCQEQMLDHLYDLLDESEQRAFLDHVAGCVACQAALEVARGQKALLAKAAKLHFPEVRFVPPTEQPVVLPLRRRGRGLSLARWAMAAALLLAVVGLGTPLVRNYVSYRTASQTVRDHEQTVSQQQEQLLALAKSLQQAQTERQQRLVALQREIQQRQMQLFVTGPRTIQPGAPTDYFVRCVDLNGNPAEAEIVAQVRQQSEPRRETTTASVPVATAAAIPKAEAKSSDSAKKDAVATLPVIRQGKGTYRVRVPAGLRFEPGADLSMLVTARKESSADKERDATGKKETAQQVSLQGEVRLTAPIYLTHLTTDKPMYQPGEVVRFRSLTLDRHSLTPPSDEFQLVYTLTNPLGAEQVLARGLTRTRPEERHLFGIGAGEVKLDEEAPGGEYTLTVREEMNRFPQATRKFLVNRYQKPRLDKKLDFNRASFGPGDEVQARVSAQRADGGPVANRPIEATVVIDDVQFDAQGNPSAAPLRFQTDAQGSALVRFRLPTTIQRGAATLAVKFDDGGVVETLSRSIPLVLKKLDVEFFPEGGDLVADLPNRVYFQARTPLGKPAQLRGTLLEDSQPLDVVVATFHDDDNPGANQGQGVFTFTPRLGKKYELRIDSPQGVTERKPLPILRQNRVVLQVPGGVFQPDDPIRVQVRSAQPRSLIVGAYCRGQLLDLVEVAPGSTEAVLKPKLGAGGVCRITVFEQRPGAEQRDLVPVAERLVYRHPKQRLNLAIQPDANSYVPGQKAKVTVRSTNEAGQPVPSLALVAVVDQSVLTLADEKTHRAMPTHFLLTTEVARPEELEYADFLLSDNPKAAIALDLLLGTQGWRRFAEQNPAELQARLHRPDSPLKEADKQQRQEDVQRLLVLSGQSDVQTTDFDQQRFDAVHQEFNTKIQQLQREQQETLERLQAARNDTRHAQALTELRLLERRWQQAREYVLPTLMALAVFGLIVSLLSALGRNLPRAALGMGLTAVCGVLLLVAGNFSKESALASKSAAQADALGADLRAREAIGDNKNVPGDAANGELERAAMGKWGFAEGGPGVGGPGIPGGIGGAMPPAPPPVMPMAAMGSGAAGRGEARLAAPGANRDFLNRPMDRARRAGELAPGRRPNLAFGQQAELRKQLQERQNQNAVLGLAGRALERLDKRMAADAAEPHPGEQLLPIEPFVFREYAHTRPTGSTPMQRSDFTETLYWHPVLLLADGQADFSFDLCDSVTSFQIAVVAHTTDGRLGAATKLLESRLPFTLSPKVPVEVTASDRLDLPVAISNNTSSPRQVELRLTSHDGLDLVAGDSPTKLSLPADGRTRRVFGFRPTLTRGTAHVAFEGLTEPFAADGIRESIRVVPDGFPITGAVSDLLEKSATHKVTLPRWLPGTLEARVEVYPSTLADLQKGLEGLLQEPSGCFEQSSTTNYPNVLILSYLQASDQANPELEKRTRELLARGYQRLTSFECQEPGSRGRRGYEWFGGEAPPHEALTAYGLLQFRDMARVHEVDRDMLERTRTYLMAQRDGKGGFKRNPRALDSFGRAPDKITNAYIVWALTESGEDDVIRELDALTEQAKTAEDAYFLSLVGLSLSNRGRANEAKELFRRVAKLQKEDGYVASAETSITGSGGRDLLIETTALATLGWLRTDAAGFDRSIRTAVRWIGQQRGGHGAFGSTQATILALKSLIAWTNANKRVPEAGELRLFVGEEKVAELTFAAGVSQPLTLSVPDAEKRLREGVNTLRVEITGEKNVFPHTLSWSYRTRTPPSAEKLNVQLTAKLAKQQLTEGESVRLNVKLVNVSGKDQGMAVAIVGLPAGLIVPEDLKQLKEHCKIVEGGNRPLVSAFEIQGRELILYWRDLAKDQTIEVPIDLIARVPGVYTGPASRAYLYYNADHRHWIEPLQVTIQAKP